MMTIISGFEDFWLLYDKKRSKKKANKFWNKLKHKDKEEIMRTLPDYIQSTPDKQFRKDPCTYLYNESWNDEIIIFTKHWLNATEQENIQSAIIDTSY